MPGSPRTFTSTPCGITSPTPTCCSPACGAASGGILPDIDTLFANRQAWRAEGNHIDQDLLSETVWPAIRHHCLIHDSVFTGCLGSVPFPPFGALQPGCHIGENSFLRFVPSA